MHMPSPTAGGILGPRPGPGRCWLTWPRVLYVAPVAVTALYGAWWITAHSAGDRGSGHTLWQSLAVAESLLALLLRRREPIGALASILAAYLLTGLQTLTLLPVLFALFSVAAIRGVGKLAVAATATAAVIIATPAMHADPGSLPGQILPRLAAAGIAIAAGLFVQATRRRTGT